MCSGYAVSLLILVLFTLFQFKRRAREICAAARTLDCERMSLDDP